MSRRRSGKPAGIQMFPFLAVLICTMGALVVLLHAFAKHGQEQAVQIARAKAKADAAQEKMDVEDVQWRIDHLREAREKTEAQLGEERLKLSHVEDHERRLRQRLEELKIAAAEMERTAEEKTDEQKRGAAELAGVKAELEETKKAVEAALASGRHKSKSYSIVPYDGRNATRRRPIYIECRESLIVLQPEGIELSPRDFGGVFGPGNPLAAAVRAKREYLADQGSSEEPYPLLLVRPEGIAAYYAARAALGSWGSEFGYELVGSDWPLKFPTPDPKLVELTRKVVAEARLRHQEYMRMSPQVAKARSRPVYRARAHGGFAPVGGSGSPGLGGGGNGGWDDFAGEWADGGSDGGDSFADSAGSRGATSPGDGSGLTDPYGDPQGIAGDRQPGGYGDSRGAGGEKQQGPYGDSQHRIAGHGPPGWPGRENPDGFSDASYGEPTPGATGRGRGHAEGAEAGPGGEAEAAEAGAEPTFAQSQSQPGNPSGGASGSAASQANPPSGLAGQAMQSPADVPHVGGGNGPPSHSDTCTAQQIAAIHGKPHSMASSRGSDWGLPESSPGAVAATRPILVECYADRLVLLPASRGLPPKEIRLAARTEDSMDELVSAVWDHMKSWGTAGRGLYWRPMLSMNVQPGGAERFAQIQALLADSGLDVHRRERRATAAPPTTRRR